MKEIPTSLIAHDSRSRRVFFISFLSAALLVVAARTGTISASKSHLQFLASIEEEEAVPAEETVPAEGTDVESPAKEEEVILTIPESSSVSSAESEESVTVTPERTIDPTTSAAYAEALRREQKAQYINDIISRTYFAAEPSADEPGLNVVELAKITLQRLSELYEKYSDRPELRYPIEDAMAIVRSALVDRSISSTEARAMEEALTSVQRALRTLPEYAAPPAPEHPAAPVDPAPILANMRVLLDVSIPTVLRIFDTYGVPVPAVSVLAFEDSKRLFISATSACEQLDPACHDVLRAIVHRLKNDLRAPMERAMFESPNAEWILEDIEAAENPPAEEEEEEEEEEETMLEMFFEEGTEGTDGTEGTEVVQ